MNQRMRGLVAAEALEAGVSRTPARLPGVVAAAALRGCLVVGVLGVGACGPGEHTPETPTQTPTGGTQTETQAPTTTPTTTASATPSPSGTATEAATPSPTASGAPTATPIPTAAPTPSPTATVTPATATPTPIPTATPTAAPEIVWISKYVEGTSGFNKAVEIYNGSQVAVDLGAYELWRISNGGTWSEAEVALSGILAPGEVYVVAHPDADDPALTGAADQLSDVLNFNGDDAVGLARAGALLDSVGAEGDDPGEAWAVAGFARGTRDQVLLRKAAVVGPEVDWASSAGTSWRDSQWEVLPMGAVSLVGSHPHPEALGHRCEGGYCRLIVPAGPFVRGACGASSGGSTCEDGALGYMASAEAPEAPVRVVTLGDVYLDQTEVTVARFKACVDAGACVAPVQGNELCNGLDEGLDDHPVNCVDFSKAQAFCAWAGGRLPTEAEWEKAARGGCEMAGDRLECEAGADDRPYPWGSDAPDCSKANMRIAAGFCQFGTVPVGSTPAGRSPYGLEDTLGNVREWCSDWYNAGYYSPEFAGGSPSDDPMGPTSSPSNTRVERGGDWGSTEAVLRLTRRSGSSVTAAGENYGLRCAYDPTP